MADNSYDIEIKPASQFINGEKRWFTPAESNAYYAAQYAREGITIHWWGDGTGANNHDNIVNYFLRRTDGSVNYVLSDNKITYMVSPDNVAFCSQSGNPTTISIEHQPTLGAEGYKKSGWLVNQLEQRYGKRLTLYPHNHWFGTACPGSIDIGRIRAEADKWSRGEYDNRPAPAPTPQPTPTPAPQPAPTVTLEIKDVPNARVKLIKDANLWNLQFAKYPDAKALKVIPNGTDFEVSAVVTHPLGSKYYISEYSYSKGIPSGINVKDTDHPDPDQLQAPSTPPPVVITVPVEPVKPPVVEPTPPVVDPSKGGVDEEQNRRLSAIEAFIEAIKKFFGGK